MEWKKHLIAIYGREKADEFELLFETRMNKSIKRILENRNLEKTYRERQDIVLITYPDQLREQGVKHLKTFGKFANIYLKDIFNVIHFLPFYPYSSDDGFSVIDYKKIDDSLGDWEDVKRVNDDFKLMYDFVCNHISAESEWVKGYLEGDGEYDDFFIKRNPDEDLSLVTRPRTSPLLTKFQTVRGEEYLWTTFSADQLDLNYGNPWVLYRVLDVFLEYLEKGCEYIRMDAVGFLWKEVGTSCIHHPKTHEIIKLFRAVLDRVKPEGKLVTETNVPYLDNIAYFGNGHDESHLVYQFPLPGLVLYSFFRKNAKDMSKWAAGIQTPSNETGFFNFLASHDGIGINPLRGIVPEREIGEMILNLQQEAGAFVSYKNNPDGSKTVYEVNVSYLSALKGQDSQTIGEKRFLTAHGVLLGIIGTPAIYIHSYIGSYNYTEGVEITQVNRAINREKNNLSVLLEGLGDNSNGRFRICSQLQNMIRIRRSLDAFDPDSPQKVLELDDRILAFERMGKTTRVLCLYNFSDDEVAVECPEGKGGMEVFQKRQVGVRIILPPYEFKWISI